MGFEPGIQVSLPQHNQIPMPLGPETVVSFVVAHDLAVAFHTLVQALQVFHELNFLVVILAQAATNQWNKNQNWHIKFTI